MAEIITREIRVKGTVQGVGFRPFVYRIAMGLGVRGEVRNDARGVLIVAAAPARIMERFVELLTAEAPPLAVVKSIDVLDASAAGAVFETFSIAKSESGGAAEIDIARDTAVCGRCLCEMRDPANRRYGHAFINCTDCGPRYTIVTSLPYDRPNTAMARFDMCPACRTEYGDPASRRFHAQPVCCPACGPALEFRDEEGRIEPAPDPIAVCIDRLKQGRIIAIKGIGGFHLACRADSSAAVRLLRARKDREEKPFALMARDRAAAGTIAVFSEAEARLIESQERPIVLARKRPDPSFPIAPEVAPGVPAFGIMLACAPLHYLLFDRSDFTILVMTSANRSDEPMAHTNEGACAALRGIAHGFLTHDRPIVMRTDDSIARIAAGSPVLLRRGRGYVPEPLPAPCDVQGIVGCGGVLKSTVAIGRGSSCYVSQYAGSAENTETLQQLDEIKNHLLKVLDVRPSCFAADLHPGSLPAGISDPGVPLMRVQHHHAHAAACMAENGILGKAVCVVYDGTGFGEDGTLWGGEIFAAEAFRFRRAGHLSAMLMPGGEAAIRHPWRMAMGALYPVLGERVADLFPSIHRQERAAIVEMLASNASCAQTSGMGRLFDALSALLNICLRRTYEGQPAMLLEGAADIQERSAYDPALLIDEDNTVTINGPAILLEAVRDFENRSPAAMVAARFHNTLARATASAAERIARGEGTDAVCLSGGCFQNALLLERTAGELRRKGLLPFVHRTVPPNDESVSYGQVVVAGMRLQEKR